MHGIYERQHPPNRPDHLAINYTTLEHVVRAFAEPIISIVTIDVNSLLRATFYQEFPIETEAKGLKFNAATWNFTNQEVDLI
jgi:hypothetical protein